MKLAKRLLILVLGGFLMFHLFGCGSNTYSMKYDYKGSYKHAKDSYRGGQKVTLIYDMIATDTNYSFRLNGESINYSYNEKKGGFEITFIMPYRDSELVCDSYNSMVIDMYVEPAPVLTYSRGVVGTDGYDRSYTLELREKKDGTVTITRSQWEQETGETDTDVFVVDPAVLEQAKELVDDCGFEKWNSLKDCEIIDGGYTMVTYCFDGYVTASTGHMPAGGEGVLNEVQELLESFLVQGTLEE